MRVRFSSHLPFYALILAFFVTMPLTRAQEVISEKVKIKEEKVYKIKEFCSHNNSNSGDKVSVSDLREMTIPATGRLEVDGARNGGISVRGENRSDVLVRACIQAWGASEEAARALASSIKVNTSGMIKADGPDENGWNEKGWSVSYEIRAPRNSNLNLKAHNGGLSIKSIDGNMELATTNGGISVYDAAGDVRGRTTNGGLNVSLVGSGWKGSGLDLQTTNGGVNLTVPAGFAANIEAGTVNGGFSSDIPELNIQKDPNDRGHQAKQVRASINGGGANVRVVTTNGGIRINLGEKARGSY